MALLEVIVRSRSAPPIMVIISGKSPNFIWRKFILLSWVFLFSSPNLTIDQAIEIFEKNQTMQSDDEISSDEIIRSSDGLHSAKPDENNQSKPLV